MHYSSFLYIDAELSLFKSKRECMYYEVVEEELIHLDQGFMCHLFWFSYEVILNLVMFLLNLLTDPNNDHEIR